MFNHQVHEKVDMEALAADMVCRQLEPLVKQHVQRSLENAIVKEVFPCFYTKKKLIEEILRSLAEKDSLEDYRAYIFNTKTFVSEWLVKYTNEHMFSPTQGSCWYVNTAKACLKELMTNIQHSVDQASEVPTNEMTIGDWITSFTSCLQKHPMLIPFKQRKIPYIYDYKAQNFEKIKCAFKDCLKLLSDNVLAHFESVTNETVQWHGNSVYELIRDALWGCEAACPFCKEPCMKSDPNHISPTDCHECLRHRPKGVADRIWTDTQKLVIEDCNYSVQSNIRFFCGSTPHTCEEKEEDTFHPYREYKKFIPEWHIQPSADMEGSEYWKWFLCKYGTQIARETGNQKPEIPFSWKHITKRDVLHSLWMIRRPLYWRIKDIIFGHLYRF